MRVNSMLTVLGSALVLATTLACSTATPTETAGVERIGRTMLRYRGPELEVTLSYGFANANLGEEWLFVDTAITGNVRESVEVKRDRIAVRTPSGDIVPLASQREFGEAYGKLAAALARADVAAQPIGNYPERRDRAALLRPSDGDPGGVLRVADRSRGDQDPDPVPPG
jgi:hypothetical protein